MKYGITRSVLSCNNFIEILQADYEQTQKAKQNLVEVLDIEEKYNFIIENYKEFEQELLNIGVDQMLFFEHDWSSFIGKIHLINRRLINLLTACRLYLDQTQHALSQIFTDKSQLENFRKSTNEEFDNNLGYRLLEKLRNYTQHKSLPIYKLNLNRSRIDKDSDIFSKYTIIPYIEVARLKEDSIFKKIIAELEPLGDYLDIKPFLRIYVECLSRIQDNLRENLSQNLREWEDNILKIRKTYQDKFTDDLLGLSIVKIDEDESIIESVDIFDEMIKRRNWFVQKNRLLTNLGSRIITNE